MMSGVLYAVSVIAAGSDQGRVETAIPMPWPTLAKLLMEPHRTTETVREYRAWKALGDPRAAAAKRSRGGWVGGAFRGDRRRADDLVSRTVVALDIDEPSPRMDEELRALDCAMVIHPSHTPGRWRVVMPLARPVSGSEYRALVRTLRTRVTGVDAASENPVQLMFWPTLAQDDERVATEVEGEPLAPDPLIEQSPVRVQEAPSVDISDVPEAAVARIEGLMRSSRGPMIRAVVAELSEAPEGARNDTLNKFAHKLGLVGCNDDEVRAALEYAAEVCGLPADETRATLDSGLSAGERHHPEAVAREYERERGDYGRAMGLFGVSAPAAPAAPAAPSAVYVQDVLFSDLGGPEPTEELWEGRIPMGALTLVSGRGGAGKSLLGCWLAAKVSLGELDGVLKGTPARTMLIQNEDDPRKDVLPRLIAAGADCRMVSLPMISPVAAVADGTTPGEPWVPTFPANLDLLADHIKATGAKLVVLDVLTAMFAGGKSTDDQVDVRAVLGGLQAVARRTDTAIVAVNHLRKGSDGTDGDDVAGSHEFRDSVRCLWLAAYDRESRRTTLRLDKYNRGGSGSTMSYAIEAVPLDERIRTLRIIDMRAEDDTVGASSASDVDPKYRASAELLGDWLDQRCEGDAAVPAAEAAEFLHTQLGSKIGLATAISLARALGWHPRFDGAETVLRRKGA